MWLPTPEKNKSPLIIFEKERQIFYVLQLIEISKKILWKYVLPWEVEEMNMSSE